MEKRRTILIDEAIPYIDPLFTSLGDVLSFASDRIDASLVKNADALIVRSVTRVDEALLANSRVSFVGTATIGTEHLDLQWLKRRGLVYASAPGCNAMAVVQYVMSAISYWLTLRRQRSWNDIRVGIVGAGQIGSRLVKILNLLGIPCEVCDPPLAEQGKLPYSSTLKELAERCDVISLHTPLTREGKYATFQMLDRTFFEQFNRDGLLINAARGGIVELAALQAWVKQGGQAILDVWPNEPEIDLELLRGVVLGTPHIAGYSLEGKLNASWQIYQQLASFWQLPVEFKAGDLAEPAQILQLQPNASLEDWFLASYPIAEDAQRLQCLYPTEGRRGFLQLRNQYPFRRDFLGQLWQGNDRAIRFQQQMRWI